MHSRTILVFTIILTTGILFDKSKAQDTWGGGYSSTCGRGGSCSLGYGTNQIGNMPYGRSGYQPGRSPYQAGYDYGTKNSNSEECSYGGGCPQSQYAQQYNSTRYGQGQAGSSNSCSGGRCPFEQNQFGNPSGEMRGAPFTNGQSREPDYRGFNYVRPEPYSTPHQRSQDSYEANPADLRPQMSTTSSAPRNNFFPNDPRSDSYQSPPEFPRQPLANMQQPSLQGSRNQRIPQTPPPTNFQRLGDPHASQDHTGCNHNH